MTKATPAPAMAIISRTAAARAGGGEEEIVTMSVAMMPWGGGGDNEMRGGGRKNSLKVRLLYQVLSQRGMVYVHTKKQKVSE